MVYLITDYVQNAMNICWTRQVAVVVML